MEKKMTKAESGSLGGKATGPQKSWVLKLPPEERSAHMSKISKSKPGKKHE